MKGYSGTPLAKKLGIKSGAKLCTAGAPKNYLKLIRPLPEGVRLGRRVGAATDIVHVFARQRARLAGALRAVLAKLKADGVIWARRH